MPDGRKIVELGKAQGKPLLYFVRGTKDTTHLEELRADERRKIICGDSHFKHTLGVNYKVVSKVEELI